MPTMSRVKICTSTDHRGGSQFRNRAWTCMVYDCRGIQAWKHHIEKDYQEAQEALLAEEHRWQRALNLPLTPIPPYRGRFE